MSESKENSISAMIFVVDNDPAERERLRSLLADSGYAVIPMESLENAESLLRANAVCHLLVVSAGVLTDQGERLANLLSLTSTPPAVIVCGVGRDSRAALQGLNGGAIDFIPKACSDKEIFDAILNALSRDSIIPMRGNGRLVASSPVTGWIELTAPSELEHLRRLQRFSDALFASSLPEKVCEDLKMAVEEVGKNAMEWGNHFNPDKRVHISYCFFDDRIVIKCEDEGEGFTPDAVPDPTTDPLNTFRLRQKAGKRHGGYGVFLIQKLVDQVVYNEKGNSVLMIKFLPDKPGSTRFFPK